jgi:hypothetical protein
VKNGHHRAAACGRSKTLQIAALSMAGDAAAVELARKIGPQIPG